MRRHIPGQQSFVKEVAEGRAGMVAAQHGEAARVGADVLAAGGNAVDAAVATSFALGVVEPWMSGIGGGGLMIVRERTGDAHALDFGMRAPAGLDPAAYPLDQGTAEGLFEWPAVRDDRNLHGPLAIAVPGLVEGMGAAHSRFGTVPWRELVAPARDLAREGFALDWYSAALIGHAARRLARYGESASWLLDDGYPPPIPASPLARRWIRHPRLADTLDAILRDGPRALRDGDVGSALAADVVELGGALRRSDLARVRVRETLPRSRSRAAGRPYMPGAQCPRARRWPTRFGGWTPTARPPPPTRSSTCAPQGRCAPPWRAGLRRWAMWRGGARLGCTSHFVAVDSDGMVASTTQTLLSAFGSMVTSRRTGVLLNNGVYWFDPRPGRPNSLGPGKRCLANMCPTVIAGEDGMLAAVGASGGRRILPSVLQGIAFLFDHGMDVGDALHRPRIDVSRTDQIIADRRMDERTSRRPGGGILRRPSFAGGVSGLVRQSHRDPRPRRRRPRLRRALATLGRGHRRLNPAGRANFLLRNSAFRQMPHDRPGMPRQPPQATFLFHDPPPTRGASQDAGSQSARNRTAARRSGRLPTPRGRLDNSCGPGGAAAYNGASNLSMGPQRSLSMTRANAWILNSASPDQPTRFESAAHQSSPNRVMTKLPRRFPPNGETPAADTPGANPRLDPAVFRHSFADTLLDFRILQRSADASTIPYSAIPWSRRRTVLRRRFESQIHSRLPLRRSPAKDRAGGASPREKKVQSPKAGLGRSEI